MIIFIVVITMSLVAAQSLAAETGGLRGAEELQGGCYGSPHRPFSRLNCVRHLYGQSPHLLLTKGDTAVDFTLRDVDGHPHTLSQLLQTRPVVMIWGMYTCPAFQGLDGGAKFAECGYSYEYNLVGKYGQDRVHFLHLYGPEPHPDLPDLNFDSGAIKLNYWSTVLQAYTYHDRVSMADRINRQVHGNSILLVDDLFPGGGGDGGDGDGDVVVVGERRRRRGSSSLSSGDGDGDGDGSTTAGDGDDGDGSDGSGSSNPVWCTYAHAARAAFLIAKNGTIVHARPWFHAGELEADLLSLLSE